MKAPIQETAPSIAGVFVANVYPSIGSRRDLQVEVIFPPQIERTARSPPKLSWTLPV